MLAKHRLIPWFLTASVLFDARDALACFPDSPPPIADVTGVNVATQIVEDTNSAIACNPRQRSTCDADVRHEGFSKRLVVSATGRASTDVDARRVERTFLLRDASGREVARAKSYGAAAFEKLAVTACVLVADVPGFDGNPSKGATREVCAPVTVKTLAPTPAEVSAYEDGLSDDCGGALGCSVRGDRGAAVPWTVAGVLLVASLWRARRRVSAAFAG
jgi:hypothetical protein